MDEAINKHIPPYDKKVLGKYAMLQMFTERLPSITFHKKITNTNSAKTFYDKKLSRLNQVSPSELTRQQV